MANEDTLKQVRVASRDNVILEQAKQRGEAFVASFREEVPSNGGVANINLRNPDGSGKVANVRQMIVRSQFEGIVDVSDAFSTDPSGGTGGIIDNLLMDSEGGAPDTGNMTVKSNVTFTGSATHVEDILPSGGPGGQIGGEAAESEPNIEPNREIVIEATNQSDTANDVAFFIIYTEEEYTG